jgi:probable HAF family extracellular repeat protein
VLWENGLPYRIPNLGGNGWHTPNMINENGVVVGFSAYDPALPADSAKTQGFLWSRATGLEPIAFLAGDDDATANSINNHDQVVGMSCGAVCRAFVWQDGRTVDLNALRQPGSSSNATLVSANDIDDLGRITGQALYRPKGASADVVVAFVASPVED